MHDMHDRKTTSSPHVPSCAPHTRANALRTSVQMIYTHLYRWHTRIPPIANTQIQPALTPGYTPSQPPESNPYQTPEHSRRSLPNTGRARSQIRTALAVKNSLYPLPQAPCIAAETPPRHGAFFHAAPWDKSRRKHIDTIRKKRFTVCPRLAKSPYLLD